MGAAYYTHDRGHTSDTSTGLQTTCPSNCPQYARAVGAEQHKRAIISPDSYEFCVPQCARQCSVPDESLSLHTGLSPRLFRELRALACRAGLDRLILFGSRARGDYRRASDIDLAASGGNIATFSLEADDLTYTPLKYDVVDLSRPSASPLISDIENEGITIYEKVSAVQV